MLIDEVNLKIKGGDGGDGSASFKNALMEKGPTGGDGGMGGSVYVQGVSDLSALRQFRHKKRFAAENGARGGNRNKDGKNGADLVLQVPVGTVAHNRDLGEDLEITKVGEKKVVAHGARGGHGNFYFRSSTNVTPRQFERGNKAREFSFYFELKLIADIGLVGLPNAGKSALLNELTAAKSRVANYRFTTLEPYLGAYFDLIIADIPGLIEGASEGKGLGMKFLRHISRCKALFHLVSCESSDLVADYKVIRRELANFDPELSNKQEFVFLTKSDLCQRAELKHKLKLMESVCKNPRAISIFNWASLQQLKKILNDVLKDKLA